MSAQAFAGYYGLKYQTFAMWVQKRRGERAGSGSKETVGLRLVEAVIVGVEEPLEVKAAPQAGRHIGEEISEQLDYEPTRFLVRRLIRSKYVRRADKESRRSSVPLAERLEERCVAASGLS